jgi:hypothetical protein
MTPLGYDPKENSYKRKLQEFKRRMQLITKIIKKPGVLRA